MTRFELSSAALARSVVDLGDATRLRRLMKKAEKGEPIVLGVIGGSITQWVMASEPRLRYANRVAAWLRERFPATRVTLVNAGRGATGSNYAALRAARDLLIQKPDLVILEFAVNDGIEPVYGETLEGLTRQVLNQPQAPAAVMLFMMRRDGTNAQARLAPVGTHYRLPMASYRDALWPEIEAGRLSWDEIAPDEVHPNDLGHELAARCVTHLLESAAARPGDSLLTPLPAPLHSDLFEHTGLFEAPALVPITAEGWALDAHADPWPCWVAYEPGSTATFELEGSTLLMMFFRKNGAYGKVAVRVDDLPETSHDAWFDQTWGGYRETTILARDLEPGFHRVSIRLLPDRNPQSTGDEFRLLALGSAGVRGR